MNVSNIDTDVAAVDAPMTHTTGSTSARRNRSADATRFKPLMVSTRQACEMLGLKDPGTVLDLIHRGKLEGVKCGNKYTITVRSLERFAFGNFDK